MHPLLDPPSASGQFVQGLARGLAVMRCFDVAHQRMRLTDIAARTGLTRATVRRSLLTLETLGYVLGRSGWYELTPRVLELGFAYLSGRNLAGISRPYLEDLALRVDASTAVTVLSGTDILYVERVHHHNVIRVDINVGSRFPAVATSMGRVLLAALPSEDFTEFMRHAHLEPLTDRTIVDPAQFEREIQRVREQGWSCVDQEFDLGLRSVAVPVPDSSGAVVAAVNVSLRASGTAPLSPPEIARYVEELRRAASTIGASLRGPEDGAGVSSPAGPPGSCG